MSNFDEFLTQDARLVILKALSQETNNTLNESILTRVLETFGHTRSRQWVRTQIIKLAELGAVRTVEAGTVMIATLTQDGLDHVQRRSVIDGIARPSLVA
ncbi:VpaChn25_0724 family phage protein [Oryzifoliimicrobium ureilyticus]|uniref:VpaChn25_0724 family phage protein n=1 Tax=Oryzifoliimicrobium ureilyticus TaxID=3113724 RepID=UPI0030767AFC